MIIWVNGSFGAGKSQTAFELNKRLENSFVFDPEKFGFRIQRDLPADIRKDDFQDYPIWRTYIAETLQYLAVHYKGTVIVPMTLVNKEYFRETVQFLREHEVRIDHYALVASEETVFRRLRKRGDGPNAWNVKQVQRCVEALNDPLFETPIDTENKPIEQVAEEIAELSGIRLKPRSSKAGQYLYRLWIQIKQVRM